MNTLINIDLINCIETVIDRIQDNNISDFNELAYISVTSKSESYFRDKIAIELQKRYKDKVISREYVFRNETDDKSNKRYDLAIYDTNLSLPIKIIELKSWYVHDIRSSKVWNEVIYDLKKINELSIELDFEFVIIFTHVMDSYHDLHDGIIKYQSMVNADYKKRIQMKYPEDIDNYFNMRLTDINFEFKRIDTKLGKYRNRDIKNYIYVISKKN
ncbi:hypothetical protein [Paenibacillus endoradicis]|uniref:hypothetical protein n=1 Tax=Paenibacillus endoradicis TaxID=2972487 RepID=UPI002158D053|nr:hypothetical protein [Paenibacillus endoradicis]MCR8655844.1 hypothetical protein [Paenibacillus endoradicis]MCR8658170.1 hypothetical protein [Paenibacillus endoradicis]